MAERLVHPTVYQLDSIGIVKFQLRYILENQRLNDTQLEVLAHVHVFKNDAPSTILASGVLKSAQSIDNYISKLRTMEVIQGNRDNLKLHKGIPITMGDIEYVLIAKHIVPTPRKESQEVVEKETAIKQEADV